MKRLRGPNFTQNDNLLLCDIVNKYKNIIENKKTDGANLLLKQKAWLDVGQEFNSSTIGCSRTVESLQQTYKNLKKKVKKRASDKKMDIPVDRATLVFNIEECGTSSQSCDWEKVALNTGATQESCKETFKLLKKEAYRKDGILKRNLMGTGGGPPHSANTDPVLEKVKVLAGPVIDGVYTIYDGDSSLMATQNVPPIELGSGTVADMQKTPENVDSENETYFTNDRANLKKKPHHLLSSKRKIENRKETVAEKFKLLATEKMDLLDLQKHLVSTQLQEERDQAEHNRLLRAMELEEDAKEKYRHNEKVRDMEIEEIKRRNEFNEKMRQF